MSEQHGDWKRTFANDAWAMSEHELVDEVIEELCLNLGQEHKGLVAYGFAKVRQYIATVTLARARGLDPDLLRMTDEEADEVMRGLIAAAMEANLPVMVALSPSKDPEG